MKRYLWVVCLLVTLGASAQTKDKSSSYTKAVVLSPLALGETDNTALIGGEYRFRHNMAVLADVGYVFSSSWTNEEKQARGFSIRPAFRIYMGRREDNYLQLQAFYKQVNYAIYDWLGKEAVNGVPAYDQLQDFNYRKELSGLNLVWGKMVPLFSDAWFADIYVGLGLRYRKLGVTSEENSIYSIRRGLWGAQQDRLVTPNLPLSVRIVHAYK